MSEETVKVVVRVRPTLEKEKNKSNPMLNLENNDFISYDLNESQIVLENFNNEQKVKKIFCFDDIFTE